MGESVTYHCLNCGKVHCISIGAFFKSPASAKEILAGERGKQAKINFERHPGNSAMFTYEVFRCSCGYARSKLVMAIYGDEEAPWAFRPGRGPVWHNARCRCSKCGRSMSIMGDLPRRIRCTCGKWTEPFETDCLFD